MSRQRDHDEFVAIMATEGVPVDVARSLLRVGATLQRIAELRCSSEAADRDRVPCPGGAETCLCRDYGSYEDQPRSSASVGDGRHGTVPRYTVREARIEARVWALCQHHGLTPIFNGDPRGAVLKLKVPSGRTNDGGREGVCVP